MALKIRERHRRGYVKEVGGYTGWHEWQVVEGRKIIARFDMEHQAMEFVEKRKNAGALPRKEGE